MSEFMITATSFFHDNVVTSYPCIKKYNYRIIGKACFITFNSLEELMQFQKDVGHSVIMRTGKLNEIGIYDDWRE